MEIADRISPNLSVKPIIIVARAKVTYGRREVLTLIAGSRSSKSARTPPLARFAPQPVGLSTVITGKVSEFHHRAGIIYDHRSLDPHGSYLVFGGVYLPIAHGGSEAVHEKFGSVEGGEQLPGPDMPGHA